MYADHLLGYRLDTTPDLLVEKARLIALRASGFVSLGMGTKTYTLALSENRDMLQAVNYVLRERNYSVPEERSRPNTAVFTVDFSHIQ